MFWYCIFACWIQKYICFFDSMIATYIFFGFYFTKENAQKYKGKLKILVILFFWKYDIYNHAFWVPISNLLIKTVLLIPILPYLWHSMINAECQKMPFYGILWHSAFVIECHKYSNMGIKRTVLMRRFEIGTQKARLWISNFLKNQNY